MNWKVRLRNPVFWVQIVVSAFAAVLAYAGLTAADLTLSLIHISANIGGFFYCVDFAVC